MIKKKLVLSSIMVCLIMTLAACGETMYELTPEEEGAVVSYAAHTLSKYNIYQNDGLVFVPANELVEEEQETEEPASVEEAISEEAEADSDSDLASDETETDDEDGAENVFGNGQTYDGDTEPKADLNQALNLGPVRASYQGYEVSKDYVAEDIFSMTADPGKTYFVVKIRLENTSSDTVNVDLLAARPSFGLLLNGNQEAVAMTTVLLNDLGTFQENLAPQETADTVLLFSVNDDVAQGVSTVGLRVLFNSNKSDVEF